MPRKVSSMSGAPASAMLSVSSGAVSSGAMSISSCMRMSPVSIPASMRMEVTPVCVSPLAMAQLMGAAPRDLGSSEAWRLVQPSLGMFKRAAEEQSAAGREDEQAQDELRGRTHVYERGGLLLR